MSDFLGRLSVSVDSAAAVAGLQRLDQSISGTVNAAANLSTSARQLASAMDPIARAGGNVASILDQLNRTGQASGQVVAELAQRYGLLGTSAGNAARGQDGLAASSRSLAGVGDIMVRAFQQATTSGEAAARSFAEQSAAARGLYGNLAQVADITGRVAETTARAQAASRGLFGNLGAVSVLPGVAAPVPPPPPPPPPAAVAPLSGVGFNQVSAGVDAQAAELLARAEQQVTTASGAATVALERQGAAASQKARTMGGLSASIGGVAAQEETLARSSEAATAASGKLSGGIGGLLGIGAGGLGGGFLGYLAGGVLVAGLFEVGHAVAEISHAVLDDAEAWQLAGQTIQATLHTTQSEAAAVREQLAQSSKGISLESTFGLATKLGPTLVEQGFNTGDVEKITQTLNQLTVISGTSSQAATRAFTQLAQAFALNRLQGQDLRILIEDMPPLFQLLAESTHKSQGELQQMAHAGQLTADVLATALLSSTGQVGEQFGQMGTNISQGMQDVANAVEIVSGHVNDQVGFVNALGAAFESFATFIKGPLTQEALGGLAHGLKDIADGIKDTIDLANKAGDFVAKQTSVPVGAEAKFGRAGEITNQLRDAQAQQGAGEAAGIDLSANFQGPIDRAAQQAQQGLQGLAESIGQSLQPFADKTSQDLQDSLQVQIDAYLGRQKQIQEETITAGTNSRNATVKALGEEEADVERQLAVLTAQLQGVRAAGQRAVAAAQGAAPSAQAPLPDSSALREAQRLQGLALIEGIGHRGTDPAAPIGPDEGSAADLGRRAVKPTDPAIEKDLLSIESTARSVTDIQDKIASAQLLINGLVKPQAEAYKDQNQFLDAQAGYEGRLSALKAERVKLEGQLVTAQKGEDVQRLADAEHISTDQARQRLAILGQENIGLDTRAKTVETIKGLERDLVVFPEKSAQIHAQISQETNKLHEIDKQRAATAQSHADAIARQREALLSQEGPEARLLADEEKIARARKERVLRSPAEVQQATEGVADRYAKAIESQSNQATAGQPERQRLEAAITAEQAAGAAHAETRAATERVIVDLRSHLLALDEKDSIALQKQDDAIEASLAKAQSRLSRVRAAATGDVRPQIEDAREAAEDQVKLPTPEEMEQAGGGALFGRRMQQRQDFGNIAEETTRLNLQKQALDAIADPFQKYQDAIAKAQGLLSAGIITTQQYARTVIGMTTPMDTFIAEGKRLEEQELQINAAYQTGNITLRQRNQLLQQTSAGRGRAVQAERSATVQNLYDQGDDPRASEGQKAFAGLQAGAIQLEEAYGNSSKLIGGYLTNAFNQGTDALTQFITTGKADFRGLVVSLLQDLTKLAIQYTIIAAVRAAAGLATGGADAGAGGGVTGAVGGTGGNFLGGLYRMGGAFDRGREVVPFLTGAEIVNRPTMFPLAGGRSGLMGEAGPEAVMPLTRTASGAMGVRAVNDNRAVTAPSLTVQMPPSNQDLPSAPDPYASLDPERLGSAIGRAAGDRLAAAAPLPTTTFEPPAPLPTTTRQDTAPTPVPSPPSPAPLPTSTFQGAAPPPAPSPIPLATSSTFGERPLPLPPSPASFAANVAVPMAAAGGGNAPQAGPWPRAVSGAEAGRMAAGAQQMAANSQGRVENHYHFTQDLRGQANAGEVAAAARMGAKQGVAEGQGKHANEMRRNPGYRAAVNR